MDNHRVLAYTLATVIPPEDHDDITGGAGPIIIPTIKITGAPLIPDTVRDSS